MIGVAVDEAVGRRLRRLWERIAVTSLLMTPMVATLVMEIAALLTAHAFRPSYSLGFLWQVLVISALVMTLRALTWRPPRTVVETRTVIAPPLPEAEAAFRNHLSARRRGARLIAVQAEDHYLRVHTDAGEELLTMRFADAVKELARAHGFQTHRSWWVAAEAVESVRWRQGVGEARLAGGLTAPVSRTHAMWKPVAVRTGRIEVLATAFYAIHTIWIILRPASPSGAWPASPPRKPRSIGIGDRGRRMSAWLP